MLFNSFEFIFVFLPIALTIFYLLALYDRSRRLPILWLGLSSLIFYGWWDYHYLPLLLASIIINYGCSRLIESQSNSPRVQSFVLFFGVLTNLLVLFLYKYLAAFLNFFDETSRFADIALPLGISFFTFTQIGYLIDVKQGVAKERGPLNYFAFVTFFPHLIAGPILHNKEIMPQFNSPQMGRFNIENLAVGLTIFAIGIAKKVLIADNLATIADPGFAQTDKLAFFAAWSTALAYAFQLYFDFSGYSDMAIGLARMFGVTFPQNFNSPYKATSIIDLWQRWHMTLTRYLTTYIYNPLALSIVRSRAAKGLPTQTSTLGGFLAVVAFPTLVTMTLAGIWHGAGLQFLVFGVSQGIFLCINHAWRAMRRRRSPSKSGSPASRAGVALSVVVTFLAILTGFIFFRSPSLYAAFDLLSALCGGNGIEPMALPGSVVRALTSLSPTLIDKGFVIEGNAYPILLALAFSALFLTVWTFPNTQEIFSEYAAVLGKVRAASKLLRWRPNYVWTITAVVLLASSIMSLTTPTKFLYFQF